ncbi:TonB-dependent receptor [Altericroceibacterium endophyticum]|uniref:TonB-dependent receptor n=1 Tax=Altericroceibacterium endophyticum TaxID=1808508 RepID=A0A6I4T7D7_9SPHN|nr:TonB-dependent receptor [Altericroceibacterium endophyticum]MXO66152.1 TonB-dependent receptor [Altericroceibacterium endophyticum]
MTFVRKPSLGGSTAVVWALGALAGFGATPALAQSSGGNDDDIAQVDLSKEIVVTAQFREQALQDTPIAITAVTDALLEARSQTNIAEVANQAPSVALRPQTASFGPSISASIRGMGQYDFNPLVEPGVGLYIDDVYYPRLTGANFELLDVERVEILRGPQGTLTGRNSEGGAIKFISKRPDGTTGGFVSGTYGSRDRVNLRGAVQFPLTDTLAARFSGTYGRQDGYVQGYDYGCLFPDSGVPTTIGDSDCKTLDFGDVNYHAFRGAVRWQPSDRVDIMLSADYNVDDTNQTGEVLLYGDNSNPNVLAPGGLPLSNDFICGRYCNYTDFGYAADTWEAGIIPALQGLPVAETQIDNRSYFKGWGVALNAEFELSDSLALTSITAYREFKSVFSNDADASPARTNLTESYMDSNFFSQELRLNFEVNDMIEATVGGYYSDELTDNDSFTDIRYIAAGGLPLYPLQQRGYNPVSTTSKAVFGTVFIRPTPMMTITLGTRYTDEKKSVTLGRRTLDNSGVNPFVDPVGAAYGEGYSGPDTLDSDNDGDTTEIVTALNGYYGEYSGDRIDYRASVDYRFSESLLAYATISTGFKGGGIGPRPFNASQVQPFGPEELTAYEIGLKTDFLDGRARLNLSGYINKLSGAQLTLLSCPQFGGPGPCALPQNAGDATIKGFEAEFNLEPVDHFDINASMSYLDWNWDCVVPTVVDSTAAPGQGCSSDPIYTTRLAAPSRGSAKWQWSIGAQYRVNLGTAGSLTPRVDVSYQGEQAGSNTEPLPGTPSEEFGTVPSYTLTNARLTWRNPDEDLEVALEVTNVFDEYYFSQVFDLTGAGGGFITGAPARPREWALSVKKKF